MASAIFFMTYILLGIFDSRRFVISDVCLIIYYAYCIASVQIPFAFVAFTTYRFCLILYHTRPFFRTNKWVILCIGGQWISEFVISAPLFLLLHDYCQLPSWILIYLCIWVTIIPSFINAILNIRMFIYVRSSAHRVQPAFTVSKVTKVTNVQQQQQQQQQRSLISRREISLLRQMILMFITFMGGWGPTYILLFITEYISVNKIIRSSLELLCISSLLVLTINLIICNRDIRQHLFTKICCCFVHG
ncbi:unnamed protein product [Adineta ricciae]|uniref:G-protein coupled receptors family 1 profile domain-containing protein n=2 Tax=Adineta ricciae TaxID=249248 RepID=A0A815PB98_ADIRI|nr:unnamed protein product [Adineta ricciae]